MTLLPQTDDAPETISEDIEAWVKLLLSAWLATKQRVLAESWKKENTRQHWQAMLEETKAECAYIAAHTAAENAKRINELEAKIETYRASAQQLAETVGLLIKMINRRDDF